MGVVSVDENGMERSSLLLEEATSSSCEVRTFCSVCVVVTRTVYQPDPRTSSMIPSSMGAAEFPLLGIICTASPTFQLLLLLFGDDDDDDDDKRRVDAVLLPIAAVAIAIAVS